LTFFFVTCFKNNNNKRVGWIIGQTDLGGFGAVQNVSYSGTDNSGLWTSVVVLGQVFKLASSSGKSAMEVDASRQSSWEWLSGLEFLLAVTGVKGLPARTAQYNITPPSSQYVNSSVFPGWVWKSDTSSDEITGHLVA